MRLYWLLLSCLSALLVSLPAEAAQLLNWRFNASQNQLAFTTDDGVQPRAQLIFNPTRLVIDLPGTSLGSTTQEQRVGSLVRSVRVGQFNSQTTRLVVELAPGYTIDPDRIQFRGIAPNQWIVEIPPPTPMPASPPTATADGSAAANRINARQTSPSSAAQGVAEATAQVEGVRLTQDGIFIRTAGNVADTRIKRSRDRVEIDLQDAVLSSRLRERQQSVNRYGVSRLKLSEVRSSPPVVRVTLNVQKGSPDWQASVSDLGGVVLLPVRGTEAPVASNDRSEDRANASPPARTQPPPARSPRPTIVQRPDPRSRRSSSPPNQSSAASQNLATIRSVDLAGRGTRLIVSADRPLKFNSQWDRPSNVYRITIPSARLADKIEDPKLTSNSTIQRLRLRQEDAQTVTILIEPASGVQIGQLTQPNARLLSLELRPRSRVVSVPPARRLPTPRTSNPPLNPRPIRPTPTLPRPGRGRRVVVIDPGHGGKDPGAIGIGGLYEKHVILPISLRVASLLEQQGVQVVMTRKSDYFVTLQGRVDIAERANATLFVSIHANAISMSRPDVNGLETYYFSSGRGLAQSIHNSVLRSIRIGNRGVRKARFYVLRKSSMPAVLVEVGFLTGRIDAANLANSAHRDRMATAIANGILQYLKQNY